MRLRIEYCDQDGSFAAQLPREGTVVAHPTSCDWQLSWYLVHLDAPVTYEQFDYTHLLLASRWDGHAVDGPEPTSVFLLLVPPSHGTVADGFTYKDFLPVAWGMSHVVSV